MVAPHLHFSLEHSSPCLATGFVSVDANVVATVTEHVTNLYQQYRALPGYEHKTLPHAYARSYFAAEIQQDTEEYLYKHMVLQFLLEQLTNNYILVANWPRLAAIQNENGALLYQFTLPLAPSIVLKEWKHFVFKQPERKNYKDLDNQVLHFMKQAMDISRKQDHDTIEPNDWIYFSASLLDGTSEKPLFEQVQHYWMRLSPDEVLSTLQKSFIGKALHETFVVSALPFNSIFCASLQEPFKQEIKIELISKGTHLSIDFFKSTFKLKTRADVHKKLIEVFSFRNDISQRRLSIEELFHLLLSKHRYEIPKHIITRKKEVLLASLKKQSDYIVYKTSKNFDQNVTLLAEKSLKEELIIDHITSAEGITVSSMDIAYYLHLFNNERLKEFIYFKPPVDNIEDSAVPIHEAILAQTVLREKTLNYVLHTLS